MPRHYCPGTGSGGASGDELSAFASSGLSLTDLRTTGSTSIETPGASGGSSHDHIVLTEMSVNGHTGYLSVIHLRETEDGIEILAHRSFP